MKALAAAFAKAQQDFPALIKDATNPAFRSRYATLAAVQETAFPVLNKHGMVVMQEVKTEWVPLVEEPARLMVSVKVTLIHIESGESVGFELGLPAAKTDPQGVGSATTYARRFALMTILGLAAEDDDGNGASKPAPAKAASAPARASAAVVRDIMTLAGNAYPNDKDAESKLSEWASQGNVKVYDELTPNEAQALIVSLQKKIAKDKAA